ncbi:MAG TPA: hypothetical protein VFP84_09405 [Kofleriaceae bacterium]|nr:hypothetical protein [Kofleriaceae bacterium]
MKQIGWIGSLLCAVVMASGAACVSPSAPAPDETTTSVDEATTSADETAAAPDAVTPRTNCSIVQFCNAPGADGPVCEQLGCTLGTAESECRTELKNVCGTTSVNSYEFITTSGQKLFCHGTTCCDGIHCSTGCPCALQ